MLNVFLYVTVVLAWSFTWMAIKYQLGIVPAECSVGYRFLLASALITTWLIVRKQWAPVPTKSHLYFLLQGFCLFGMNFIFAYNGTHYLTSGLVALVFSSIIFFNIINGAVFLKKPLEWRTCLGATLGFTGMACVFFQEFSSLGESESVLLGLALVFAGAYCASLGNLLAARNSKEGLPLMQTSAIAMAYGGAACLLYSYLFGHGVAFDASLTYVGSLAYLAIIGTIVGFSLYLILMLRIGMEKAAYVLVLSPITALMASAVLEDYRFTPLGLLGILVILAGNVLVLWQPRRMAAA